MEGLQRRPKWKKDQNEEALSLQPKKKKRKEIEEALKPHPFYPWQKCE